MYEILLMASVKQIKSLDIVSKDWQEVKLSNY